MATGSTRLMAAFARRLAPPPTGSDADLLDRFATYRDEAAFGAILHRHGAAVLGVCRSRLHNVVDAEDAFQATFLVLARDAERIRNRESLAGWLYRVAQLVSLKARRQNAEDGFFRRAQDKYLACTHACHASSNESGDSPRTPDTSALV